MSRHRALLIPISLILSALQMMAQSAVQPRITQPIDEQKLVRLQGNTHPLAQARFDRGAAPDSLPTRRMLLLMRRGADQESELQRLLEEQQTKSSPSYHRWLSPREFGQQFGPADADIATLTAWLQSQGFNVNKVAAGRTLIEFSGTAGQVRQAFHTEIHKFEVNGEEHWANASDPQIPAALAPVVRGIVSLHNFRKKPQIKISDQRISATVSPGPSPQVTFQNGEHALGPGDYAVIYNINQIPAASSGAQGGFGTTIAVVGRSNINIQDVSQFRNIFGLPSNNPQVLVDGVDPGDLGGGEEAEAVLDTTWSGAVAPGASVVLVVSASTEVTDGVDLSELYIIDNNVGDVMTESFLNCEANATSVEASAVEQLAEQAAAQGITYIVASGDAGSAGCDDPSETQATGPLSVNLLAATPFNVAVGGTQFNEHGSNSLYWSSTNNQYTLTSARSYIPEDVWNESCTVAQCGQTKANIAAGGGGASTFFAKPPWQSGGAGIPSDGMRDVPDVSLTAALHDPYLLCLDSSCVPDSQGRIQFYGVGGTSAAAPSFAAITALVRGAVSPLNSPVRLGQINPVLYGLASKETLSICNGSSIVGLPASSCIFNDVTVGNNAVPGEPGYGTSSANYLSGTGYDLATGLGSVNVADLVKNWTTSFDPTSTTLTISPTTFTHGTPVQVNIAVTSPSGTPTGQVALYTSSSGGSPVPGNSFTLDNTGGITTTMKTLPGGGLYTVTAHYAGDGTFDWSDSSPVQLSVTPENSNTYLHLVTFDSNFNPIFSATTTPYGSPYLLRADVTNTTDAFQTTPACSSGCPTGNVAVSANPPLVGGTFKLNSLGYTEDQAIQLPDGNYNLSANYQGDASFNASSGSLMVNISPAPTTVTAGIPTSVQYGVLQQITGAVKTTSNGVAPGGTFTFFDNAVQLSGISIDYWRSPYNPSMSPPYASLTGSGFFPFASIGPHSLTMQYTGDSNYAGGTSPAYAFTVVPASTYFVGDFANPNPTTPNLAVTLSSSVGTSSTLGPPTGAITYYDGTTVLGTATVAQPQLVHTFTDLGTHTITAQYSGDANFASSTMPPLTLNVYNQLPTAIANLYTASNPPVYGIPTTVYAMVQRTGFGGPAMSGTVSFTDNGTGMAGTVTYQYNTNMVLASLPVTYNSLGNHTIVAQYSGDSNYAPSQSQISFSVGAPFNLAGGGTFSMGRAGGSGTVYVTIFPDSNSTLPVNLSCASSSPKATCSVVPNSVTLNNGGISTVVVNYTVPALGAKLMSPRRLSQWAMAAGAIFGGVFLLFVPGSRRRRGITLVVLLIALTTGMVACGGGGAAGVPGPTSQIYTFTVTGTLATDNTVTASTTFTVTVQ